MHTERSTKRRNAELIIGICILIYSLHIKRRNTRLTAPRFSHTQSIPALCLQRGEATFVSCASALATVPKCSFVELGSRSARRWKESKTPSSTFYHLPGGLHTQHNAVIKNSYTWKEPVPHQLADVSLYWRTCSSNCWDKKFVFLSSSHPCPCTQEKGGPAISLLASFPSTPQDIKEPSPPLCTLCLKRHLQRCVLWVVGGGKGKKGIFTYRAVAGS